MKIKLFPIMALVLLIGLVITYSNHFTNPFHFDDHHTIVDNQYITSLKYVPKYFVDASTTSSLPANQGYRPCLTLLNAIDYYIAGGLDTRYFHLSIFSSYIILLVLLFFFFKKIFELAHPHQYNKYLSLFAVAFFGYHTANAETINYIIARSDSFSTLMVVVSIMIFINFPKLRKFGLYLLPFVFGFLVKEPTIMTLPILGVYLLLFELPFRTEKYLSAENFKVFLKAIRILFPMFIAALILFWLSRKMTPPHWVGAIYGVKEYLITQPFVIVHYFWNFFLPNHLSADTDWKILDSALDARFILGSIFIIGLIAMIIRLARIKEFKPAAFGLSWFLLALAPTSSVVPLSEVLNDHRTFFPYIGLCIAVFNVLFYYLVLHTKIKIKPIVMTVAMFLILTIHAFGTHHRNYIWSSSDTLWKDAAEKSPKNGRALMNYGLALMRNGKFEEAMKYYEEALVYNPYYSYLYINIAICKKALGKVNEVEANYHKAIQYSQGYYGAFYYYGLWLIEMNRLGEAIQMLKQALQLNPVSMEVRYALMQTYLENQDYGPLLQLAEETLRMFPNDVRSAQYAMAAKGRKTKLELALEEVKANPTPENYLNLSLEYYNAGHYEDCINACNEALKLKPDYALAYNNICTAYNQLGQYDKAIEACNKALQLSPQYELAKNNLKIAQENKAKKKQ